ncbi:MAG: lytic transglycosylase domain-containing protein, partial [Thermodesulfobacteriota bacterium]
MSRKIHCIFILLVLFSVVPAADAENITLRISYDLAEQLPMSNFDLYLLSTVTGNKSNEKAIVKNPINERIKAYKAGEIVGILENEEVRIVKIFPCMSVLEQGGRYYKLYCKSRIVDNSYFTASSLSGYIVGDSNQMFSSNAFNESFDTHIIKACNKYGVDPYLVKAVIRAESNFDPNAVSPKNAKGLMQITPPTANDYEVRDILDPTSNIEGGVRILKHLIDYFDGNVELALAGYNAGKYAVIKYDNQIPPYPETQQYVARVLSFYS